MLSDKMIEMLDDLPVILSIYEVAEFLKVSYLTVYRQVKNKELPAYKNDGDWCILRSDLKKYCSKHCNL